MSEKKYMPPPYRGPGRPSKYKKEFCQRLYDHLAQGLSYETFGAVIGVNTDTLYQWQKKHPEFTEAKKAGMLACQLYWEKIGIFGMRQKNFNAAIYIWNMKNRFRNSETWAPEDKIETDHTITIAYDPKKLKRPK